MTVMFGVSHYATTTTVLAFFLGFALGAHLVRRFVDRASDVAMLVIGLEAAIAGFAWLSPRVFELVGAVTEMAAAGDERALSSVVLTRAAAATAAILFPTICMGATLPVFYRLGISQAYGRGSRIGWNVTLTWMIRRRSWSNANHTRWGRFEPSLTF